ncbi:MAG TPA: hypothetical protein PL070_08235 [Flavobacteriales bacterium]|nr:hypothetical protein [Flavobacteriales bacterium]
MQATTTRSLASGHSAVVVRLFATFLCWWLFMAPQVTYSTSVIAFCNEHDCSIPPLMEEEEVCHVAVPPRASVNDAHASPEAHEVALPHWEELLLHTLHGEVPHPPPWA